MGKMYVWPVFAALGVIAVLGGGLILYADSTPPWLERQLSEQAPPNEPPISSRKSTQQDAARKHLSAPMLTVEEMRARCVDEIKSNVASGIACKEYEKIASLDQPDVRVPAYTYPPSSSLQATPLREPDASQPKVTATVRDCRLFFGYGTIPYRKCRAKEADRLRNACLKYTGLIQSLLGNERERAYWHVNYREYCRESDRYRVVD